MASAIPQNLPSDHNRGPLVEGLAWGINAVAIVIVVLRLYTRLVLRKTAGVDDLLMVIALVS